MNIHVVVFMKKTEKFYENAAAEYEKRLGRYCKIKVSRVSPGKKLPEPEEPCFLLAPGGRMMSSEELAEEISGAQIRGVSRVTVVIPGEEDFDVSDLGRTPEVLSLSPMEMSPGLMLTVVLEQIYRAYKIIHNETYHK